MLIRVAIASSLAVGCSSAVGHHGPAQDASSGEGTEVDAAQIAASCDAIRRKDPGAASGMYMIDPDGPGGSPPVTVACDMTTDGGGWTIVFVPSSINLTANPVPYTVAAP